MAVWNVAVPVIANLEAATAQEAENRLAAALEGAGFATYREGSDGFSLRPFEAETGTEPETLPVWSRRAGLVVNDTETTEVGGVPIEQLAAEAERGFDPAALRRQWASVPGALTEAEIEERVAERDQARLARLAEEDRARSDPNGRDR